MKTKNEMHMIEVSFNKFPTMKETQILYLLGYEIVEKKLRIVILEKDSQLRKNI
jgi:hypothetical protein